MFLICQFSEADELSVFSTLDWRCELVQNLVGLFITTIVHWSFFPQFWLNLGSNFELAMLVGLKCGCFIFYYNHSFVMFSSVLVFGAREFPLFQLFLVVAHLFQ